MAAFPANAQQATTAAAVVATDEYVELDPITVVATRTEESWIDTLAGVSVVRLDDIEQMMPTRTEDLFLGMPSVTAIQNGNSSQTSINIRGLQDFGRVAVIVDGARQNFTQLGHADAAGSFFVEPGLIADVDVVRGPVSNIYGSGAIGGVVTMRTKDAEDIIPRGKTWGVEADGEFGTNGPMGYGSLLAATKVGQNVDLFAGGTFRKQDDYKDGDGNTVDQTGYQTWTGLAKATIRPADFHEIKFSFLNYDSQYDTANSELTPTTTAYSTDVANRTATASWNYSNPDNKVFDWRSTVYWNQVDMDQVKIAGSSNAITGSIGDPRNFTINTVGFDANNTSRFEWNTVRNAITYGGDYFHDDVKNTDNYGFGDGYNPSGERGVGGAFVQWKANYSTWLEGIAAVRYDAYSLDGDGVTNDGSRFSPKFTLGYTPVQWFTLYGTYAEGYRAPAVTETLVEGFHPPVGGPPFAFIPNPNLKPEIGKNLEAGINIKYDGLFTANDKLRVKANIYRNNVDDFIESVLIYGLPYDPASPCPVGAVFCYQYQNVEEARLEGFEFEGTYDARRWFAGLSGQTMTGKSTAGPSAGEPLSSVPPDQISATIGARFFDEKLTVSARWTAVAAKKASDLPEDSVYGATDSFNLVSIYAGYQPTPNALFRLSIENLLDEQYTQYENFLPSAGLTVKGGLTIRFGGGEVASAAPPLVVK